MGLLILGGGQATRLPGKLSLAFDDELPMIARVYRNITGTLSGSSDGGRTDGERDIHGNEHEKISERSEPRERDEPRERHEPREVYVSCKETFARDVDALLPVPMVVDRWNARGPLGGMLTTMAAMRSRFVFAVAGDAPFIDATFIETLCAAHHDGNRNGYGYGDGNRNGNSDGDGDGDGEGDEAVVPVHERDGKLQYEPLAALYDRLAFLREGIPVLRSGRGAPRSVIDRLRTRTVSIDDPRIFTNVNTPADYAALRAQLAQEPT